MLKRLGLTRGDEHLRVDVTKPALPALMAVSPTSIFYSRDNQRAWESFVSLSEEDQAAYLQRAMSSRDDEDAASAEASDAEGTADDAAEAETDDEDPMGKALREEEAAAGGVVTTSGLR